MIWSLKQRAETARGLPSFFLCIASASPHNPNSISLNTQSSLLSHDVSACTLNRPSGPMTCRFPPIFVADHPCLVFPGKDDLPSRARTGAVSIKIIHPEKSEFLSIGNSGAEAVEATFKPVRIPRVNLISPLWALFTGLPWVLCL